MFVFKDKDFSESLVTMILVLGFWVTITFPAEPFSALGLKNIFQHLILGIFFAFLVAFLIPYPILTKDEIARYLKPLVLFRFFVYILELCLDIIRAGIDVANRVLRRDLRISPGIVEVETPLCDDVQIALNANSITLTPGTITIDTEKTPNGSRFLVHCISQEAVEDIMKNGGFVKRLQRCFDEEKR